MDTYGTSPSGFKHPRIPAFSFFLRGSVAAGCKWCQPTFLQSATATWGKGWAADRKCQRTFQDSTIWKYLLGIQSILMLISLIMYINVCVHTHTHIHIYIFAYIHIYIYDYICIHMYIHIYICVCVLIWPMLVNLCSVTSATGFRLVDAAHWRP